MQSKIGAIISGATGKTYRELLEDLEFEIPHQFIDEAWQSYKLNYPKSPVSTNGRLFELVVAECLAQRDVSPFYFQASLWLVSNSDFDILLYDKRRPVVLSMKTSLRERYKQAALEGMQLKYVYNSAEVYLITLDEDEAKKVKEKISSDDIAGLDNCILATSQEFSDLINNLAQKQFSLTEPINPIEKGKAVQS